MTNLSLEFFPNLVLLGIGKMQATLRLSTLLPAFDSETGMV
jgi:hypothetical protein